MAFNLAKKGGDDSTYFDCVIGNRLTSAALKKYTDAPHEVREYIAAQMLGEQCHCRVFDPTKSDLAERIASFHSGIIESRNWPSFLACMPLLGERMALTTAFCLKNTERQDQSSHTTDKGFLDEYWHTTAPLVLLALYATEEELETAAADQEGFLRTMRVPAGIYDPAAPGRCEARGRDAHTINVP